MRGGKKRGRAAVARRGVSAHAWHTGCTSGLANKEPRYEAALVCRRDDLFISNVAFANTRICVSVQQKSWYKPVAPPAPPQPAATPPAPPVIEPAPSPRCEETDMPFGGPTPQGWTVTMPPQVPPPGEQPVRRARPPSNPHELDPTQYLRRLLEYEVTHEPGFAAVDDRCEQRITVELYPLESGWTVFARYTGTEREEKIDHAEVDEFAELAQRIAFALLRNKSITHTITRENVLRADSEQNLRTINGTGHFLFGMGTAIRFAELPTQHGAGNAAQPEWRFITPVSIQIGYRRKLRAWGLDAFARLNLGTENTGVHSNDLGGNVDYSKSGLTGLHFLHYTDAPGINSFYFGGGAAFGIAQFEVDPPDRHAHRQPDARLADRRRPEHRPPRRLRVPARQLGSLLRAARGERARVRHEHRERLRKHRHLDARPDRPDRRDFLMSTRRGVLGLLAGALLMMVAAGPAAAQMRTCVRVEAGKTDPQALTKLVKSELDRHATHRAADEDCQGNLTVELLDLGGGERWVTGRINTQVPFREKVGADGIGPAVQRLLAVVLNNDPLILRAPNRTPGSGARAARSNGAA